MMTEKWDKSTLKIWESFNIKITGQRVHFPTFLGTNKNLIIKFGCNPWNNPEEKSKWLVENWTNLLIVIIHIVSSLPACKLVDFTCNNQKINNLSFWVMNYIAKFYYFIIYLFMFNNYRYFWAKYILTIHLGFSFLFLFWSSTDLKLWIFFLILKIW